MMMPHTTMKKVYGGCDPENTLLWPYRTSPLVLPGAKVKKDPPPNISYLRHHPNPMMRAAPGQYELVPEEIIQKQKVADTAIRRAIGNDVNGNRKVISRPYNSPIGLYSEQNIVNSIQSQAGLTPNGNASAYSPNSPRFRKTVVYDPSKSETYRALHESELEEKVEEINIPVTPKVFNAPKSPTRRLNAPQYNTHRASPQPHPTVPHPNANFGVPTDEIHQSNSFKRLMTMVRNEY